jgi:hypothetical protein
MQVMHIGAQFNDLSGGFSPGRKRKWRFALVFAGHEETDRKSNAGMMHTDAHLSWLQCRTLKLLKLQLAPMTPVSANQCLISAHGEFIPS